MCITADYRKIEQEIKSKNYDEVKKMSNYDEDPKKVMKQKTFYNREPIVMDAEANAFRNNPKIRSIASQTGLDHGIYYTTIFYVEK